MRSVCYDSTNFCTYTRFEIETRWDSETVYLDRKSLQYDTVGTDAVRACVFSFVG